MPIPRRLEAWWRFGALRRTVARAEDGGLEEARAKGHWAPGTVRLGLHSCLLVVRGFPPPAALLCAPFPAVTLWVHPL